jgi:predicted RecA/RadA family phage recombinase
MQNYIEDGHCPAVTAPANVNSGDLVLINSMFGVAQKDALSGEPVAIVMGGVFDLPKANAASTAVTVGNPVYWDATNSLTTLSATSNTKIGVSMAAASNTDVLVRVRLNPSF